jgi:hypothetical protein
MGVPDSLVADSFGPRPSVRPLWMRLAVVALVVSSFALAPSIAAGAACPSADTSYTGNCGPGFAVPNWTDAGGWTDPSQYSTIQLADINGDGTDELIGRNDEGLEIWWFDPTLGQWRPQVDAKGVPQALTDFRSPRPGETPATDWTKPEYYSTIRAGDVDGQPGAEIYARFSDGMRVFRYVPPTGTKTISGGSWKTIATGGPFSDAAGYDDESLYPTIQVARFTSRGQPALFARQHSQENNPTLVFYTWNQKNGTWTQAPTLNSPGGFIGAFTDTECAQPLCYLNLSAPNVAAGDPHAVPFATADVMGLVPQNGVTAYDVGAGWNEIDGGDARNPPATFGPFADGEDGPDCPFTASSPDCVGTSPSYYETLGAADVDGQPGDEVLARASDGLRVRQWVPPATTFQVGGKFQSLATLSALAGSASSVPGGTWGSIRTGDINGDDKQDVLFLDPNGKGLQAWSYDPGQEAWEQLPASPALALGSDPWLSHPEYYSTIQTGDVDGDGHDDVIARGPFGIRTWFYNRRGTGGWERYLADGYPAFPGAATPPAQDSGQAAAFDELNVLAKGVIPETATTVRDVWASKSVPQSSDLTTLQTNLVLIANCTGPVAGNPVTYQSCTPPGGTTAFSATDWKNVVNEILAEIYHAQQVVAFFSDLKDIRDDLIITEGAELPAIGGKLGLQAAAASTPTFSANQMWSLIFGIAGSIAGLASPGAGAALAVASYVMSALPSASSTAMSSFQTTYVGLQDQFAQMVTEIVNAMDTQSQEVRQDAGLLGLVGQLRSRGTWTLDKVGLQSAGNQGFAIWAYKALMPTIYDRYQITNCRDGFDDPTFGKSHCAGASAGVGVVGGGQNFTTIAAPLNVQTDTSHWVPCRNVGVADWDCSWDLPPSDLMNRIWGPVSTDCTYQPGSAQSGAWTFGCPAGVDVNTSIGDNTWGFDTHSGDPDPTVNATAAAAAAAAQRPRQAPIALGRARRLHRRALGGRAQVRAGITVPRRVRLAGATVTVDRLLFEPRGHGELTIAHGRSASRPLRLKLRRAGPGRFTAAIRSGRRSARIALRRVGRRAHVELDLRFRAPAFRAPRACHALPASVALRAPRMKLQTRLTIGDARTHRRHVFFHHVRCGRDPAGNVDRLEFVHFRDYPLRSGLAVGVRGPRRVRAGTTVRYLARVHNRRRGRHRLVSSLWDIAVRSGTRHRRIHELRRGRSRSVTFTRRVPRTARRRFCVSVLAVGPGLSAAADRTCAPVQAARAPSLTG